MEEPSLQFIRGKPLRGWLRRQGGVMRGWQRKYFVLNDKCLFCFAREDDSRPLHVYYLDDYRPAELPLSPDDSDKFMFELAAEKSSAEPAVLCAATEAERKEWMKGLVHNKYADKGGAIFGLPLSEAMKYEHQHGRTIPYIVEACVEHLKVFGMDAEGIFRLAGRAGLMKELRAQFETGQRPSLESVDVHTVGALLKAYLRELPESLVPPELYQRAMNCAMRYAAATSEEKKAEEVALMAKMLNEEIPYDHYATLSYLCDFLHRLAANSEKTKMDANNLALVFGPNLIRHMDNSPELLMLTADLTQHLAYMLIHHSPEILPPRPPPESPPAAASEQGVPAMRPKVLNNIATADLLRLSQPVSDFDPSLLLPESVRDLQGLDFCRSTDDVFTPGSRESPSSSPSSPFSFHSDHFSTKQSSLEHGDGSTSSESSSRTNTLERGLEPGSKPVPPRRNKSRKQRRPNGAPASPVDPLDVHKALSSTSHPLMSPPHAAVDMRPKDSTETQQKAGHHKADHRPHPVVGVKPSVYLVVDEKGNINGEVDSKGNTVSSVNAHSVEPPRENHHRAGGEHVDRMSPSRSDLEAQVAALKSQLMKNREDKQRSDQLMAALKSQLTEMRSKYENRITTMEKQHLSQVIDLTAKLDAEKNSRAEAVERTVALQAQLYKYKLQYGDLQE
ncbi:hypothetical protein BaRGS_00015470 [Batillaria attramentaria]|uniref:Uncharacterized protein n=1 Tax=Batillaria attramentaria TaxID=370345 RepID=A0ABD0L2K5_9CAEN